MEKKKGEPNMLKVIIAAVGTVAAVGPLVELFAEELQERKDSSNASH